MFRKVVERTQKIWIIEIGTAVLPEKDAKGDLKYTPSDRNAIAQKLATWSDFIHCTQSCCFAWIVGCALADGLCAACEEPSVLIAILILILEFLFDWHRYQHVLDITKPQAPSPANKEEQPANPATPANSENTNNN